MTRLTLFSFLLISTLQFAPLVNANQSDELTDINVSSQEYQFGESAGVFSKKSSQRELATQSDVNSRSGLAGKVDKHLAKQIAAPLSKPFLPAQRAAPLDPNFWIYDANVSFNIDNDYDGFYSTFTLEFDADTVFVEAEVYARLYLARGDVFEEYHTTSLFLIYGDSGDDSLIVVSDLLTGFPTGDYELLIELYDGLNDQLVASFDGFDDVDLTLLTLESKSFDEPQTVVIVSEHGGSFGFLILLLIPAFLSRTVVKRRT
jgi:hypothetical protein